MLYVLILFQWVEINQWISQGVKQDMQSLTDPTPENDSPDPTVANPIQSVQPICPLTRISHPVGHSLRFEGQSMPA